MTSPGDNANDSDNEWEDDRRPKVERDRTGFHFLQSEYTLWFNRRVQGARTQENYEKNIKRIGTFNTVEEFWEYYSHMVRPNDLPNTSDYHLFKSGIKPMWEDDANKMGGKWIVRLRKGQATKYWEDLVLAVVGEQFDVGNELCGAVVSIRYQEDIISLWNRTATDQETKLRLLNTLKRVLHLDETARTEYKNHDASIRDNSSFRNAEPILSPTPGQGNREKPPRNIQPLDDESNEREYYNEYDERDGRGYRDDRERDRDRDRDNREREDDSEESSSNRYKLKDSKDWETKERESRLLGDKSSSIDKRPYKKTVNKNLPIQQPK